MAFDIKVPSVGESITEVVVSQWLKAEGSFFEKDEAVVSLETDKVNVEIPAPVAGILSKIIKANQTSAVIGEVIGIFEERAAATPAAPAKTAPQAAHPVAETKTAPTKAGSGHVMPAAERVMAQAGLSASDVAGTGPGSRVLKEDALRASVEKAVPAKALETQDSASLERVVPMSPLRKRIAERLVMAQQTAAMLTTFNEIDMSTVMSLRTKYQDDFVKKYKIKLGFMSFFVKAVIDGLRQYPELNAQIRGTDIVYHDYYDIGVAVGGEKGLVVPVVRKAELLSFAECELAIGELAKKAQTGKLKLEELQGGTFTISNGGVYGSLMSTPILNPPQSGILGMHSIVQRPIEVDGKIELRPMMYVALSYDHRIVDGRGAVLFLKRVKECIERPDRMLLEV